MLIDASDSQLLLIDYQGRLMPAMHEADAVLLNASRLARGAGLLRLPVWATVQNPDRLGGVVESLDAALEGARSQGTGQVFSKMRFSACTPELMARLRPPVAEPPRRSGNARSLPRHLQQAAAAPEAPARATVVVAGVEAHVCLMQTALELLEEEFDVCVVTDACSSRTERNRDAAFDRLAAAGAELVTTEMVLFEWLAEASHPRFKDVQALIK